MIKLSMMRNLPVVCRSNQLGVFQNAVLDYATKEVSALIVSCGMRGKRIIPKENIQGISDKFIFVDGFKKYKNGIETGFCQFFVDTSGLLVGRITDIAIDEATLKIIALEMTSGYLPYENKIRTWVYAFTKRQSDCFDLTIPTCLGSELIVCSGGD